MRALNLHSIHPLTSLKIKSLWKCSQAYFWRDNLKNDHLQSWKALSVSCLKLQYHSFCNCMLALDPDPKCMTAQPCSEWSAWPDYLKSLQTNERAKTSHCSIFHSFQNDKKLLYQSHLLNSEFLLRLQTPTPNVCQKILPNPLSFALSLHFRR